MFGPKDFTDYCYVATIKELMKVSEVFYKYRIPTAVLTWSVIDDETNKVAGNGYALGYKVRDKRLKRKLDEELSETGITASPLAS